MSITFFCVPSRAARYRLLFLRRGSWRETPTADRAPSPRGALRNFSSVVNSGVAPNPQCDAGEDGHLRYVGGELTVHRQFGDRLREQYSMSAPRPRKLAHDREPPSPSTASASVRAMITKFDRCAHPLPPEFRTLPSPLSRRSLSVIWCPQRLAPTRPSICSAAAPALAKWTYRPRDIKGGGAKANIRIHQQRQRGQHL